MKNQIILWLSSIVIVFLIGYIKNITDKDYPITGTFGIEGCKVSYKLDKETFDQSSYKNIVISDIKGLTGKLIWIKEDERNEITFHEIERGLVCEIPSLKPGQKITYKLILNYNERTYKIPEKDFVRLTFWGNIPFPVNILYLILMYGGMILSIRCLLELFNEQKNLKKYAFITSALFIILTAIIFPLRNSYKLGAINSYVPPITDLLSPVLLVILLLWIVGTILLFSKKYSGVITVLLVSATVVLFFFL
ncbi:MAG: hypothetical protein OQK57_02230 [Ignavibacteriaceae bacterium]|nr:hypothetical protein [Ignavibacteriaceae bacterium]